MNLLENLYNIVNIDINNDDCLIENNIEMIVFLCKVYLQNKNNIIKNISLLLNNLSSNKVIDVYSNISLNIGKTNIIC
jgi:hypothetical protein